MLDCRSNTGTR